MSIRQVVFSSAARARVVAGLNVLADAVKVTLGPQARTVLIDRGDGRPLLANSGVVVARAIELPGRLENMGAQLVREVAGRTSEVAGDGTTTATLLAQALVREGIRRVVGGVDAMGLKRGMDLAVEQVAAALARMAQPCTDHARLAQVAALAAGNDARLGDLVAEAMGQVGPDGAISVEEGSGRESTLEAVAGLRLDCGWTSPYFENDADVQACVLEDVYVLMAARKLSAVDELLPVLELVAGAQRPLLVVAEAVEADALAALVVNHVRGIVKACAVRAPGLGDERRDLFQDLAVALGGVVVEPETGMALERVRLADLGRARRVEVTADATTIVGAAGDAAAVRQRVRDLRAAAANEAPGHARERLERRAARLAGGVAVLKVGAATETEMRERRTRLDDALHAARAAAREGVVPGGGVALLRARDAVEQGRSGDLARDAGAEIVARALEEPLRQIVANAGGEPSTAVARVAAEAGSFGYDAATGTFTDLAGAGVLDPVMVTTAALRNAASIAGLVLTTDCVVADEEGTTDAGLPA